MYPHSTLKGTPTSSSHSGAVTYVTGQEDLDVYMIMSLQNSFWSLFRSQCHNQQHSLRFNKHNHSCILNEPLRFCQRSFFHRWLKLWNKLPEHVASCATFVCFQDCCHHGQALSLVSPYKSILFSFGFQFLVLMTFFVSPLFFFFWGVLLCFDWFYK